MNNNGETPNEQLMFFDMQLTGYHKNTTPISIGIVLENGAMFYGEFDDYDKEQCDEWITANVITQLYHKNNPENVEKQYRRYGNYITSTHAFAKLSSTDNDCEVTYAYGPSIHIMTSVLSFLAMNGWNSNIKLIPVSDVPHYEFMAFTDFMAGDGFKLGSLGFAPSCYDVNQLIAENNPYNLMNSAMFTRATDVIIKKEELQKLMKVNKAFSNNGNSLYNAMVTKLVYEKYK